MYVRVCAVGVTGGRRVTEVLTVQDGEQRCAGASGGRECPPGSCEVLPAPRTLLPLWKLLIMAEGMKLVQLLCWRLEAGG